MAKGEPSSPLLCSVDYAVKALRAGAVGYTIYAGSEHEARMFAVARPPSTRRWCLGRRAP
jgi:DhnA family fructose-bisphosphate aldolase class Ia